MGFSLPEKELAKLKKFQDKANMPATETKEEKFTNAVHEVQLMIAEWVKPTVLDGQTTLCRCHAFVTGMGAGHLKILERYDIPYWFYINTHLVFTPVLVGKDEAGKVVSVYKKDLDLYNAGKFSGVASTLYKNVKCRILLPGELLLSGGKFTATWPE